MSVVIPAYNEEDRLRNSLQEILAGVETVFPLVELIVVNDGSTDGTRKIAEEFSRECLGSGPLCRVINLSENRGKGRAVREGFLAASQTLVLMTDADLSTPVEELTRLLRVMDRENADIVIGSRALRDSDVLVPQPWYREYGGKGFNLMVRAITRLPYRDTQCGFKLFKADRCRSLFVNQKIDRFAFDVEILFNAMRSGLRVVEEPVVWKHAEGSKVRMLSDSFWTFCELVRIRINGLGRDLR